VNEGESLFKENDMPFEMIPEGKDKGVEHSASIN
jgi:hypothetical protein